MENQEEQLMERIRSGIFERGYYLTKSVSQTNFSAPDIQKIISIDFAHNLERGKPFRLLYLSPDGKFQILYWSLDGAVVDIYDPERMAVRVKGMPPGEKDYKYRFGNDPSGIKNLNKDAFPHANLPSGASALDEAIYLGCDPKEVEKKLRQMCLERMQKDEQKKIGQDQES